MLNPLDSISQTSVKLLLSEPFYGHFMMALPKEISDKMGTAGVALLGNDTVKLIVNSEYWNGLNEHHRYGVIKHEMLHLILKHLFMMKNFGNKKLFNIAADLVVNQYITSKQLPLGALTIARFAHLEYSHGIILEYDKDVGYYYRMLDKALKSESKCSFESASSMCSGGGSCAGSGKGDGAGNESENAPGDGQADLKALLRDGCAAMDSHKFWSDLDNLSEGQRKLAEYQCNRLIQGTANRLRHKTKNFGNLPAGLVERLNLILDAISPQFDWRRVLRLFGATSSSTYIKNTIRRPSKRYRTVPGLKVKRRNRLLVAIDTSGSINMLDLQEFFGELYFIWRQGAEIQVVDCDTHIHQIYQYKGSPPDQVKGGGGTDFSEPIIYGNNDYKPDGMIYFTDGHAGVPRVPPRFPVLWVISSCGIQPEDPIWNRLPGKVLKLN